jgi:hypothetical protein
MEVTSTSQEPGIVPTVIVHRGYPVIHIPAK